MAIVIFLVVKADKSKNEKAAFEAKTPKAQPSDFKQANQPTLPPVQKTANVDAVVDGIVADYSEDSKIAAEGDADAQYISDSASLINSEGVYNANEF